MGMFDGITDSIKSMVTDTMAGVETKAHQFVKDEEQVAVRAFRTALIGTTGYALLIRRFAPTYEYVSIFASPLLYSLTAKQIAGNEAYLLGAGLAASFK